MNPPRHEWNEQLLGHLQWLRVVVHSRLGESHHVDDVLQDVMADALAVNPGEVQTLRPWLYRIAIRKIGLFRRSAGRTRRAYRRIEASEGETSETPLDLLLGKERRHLVGTALNRLPGRDVEILVLKYVHNWSYQTICDHLGITHAKVTHRLRTARKRLRIELGRLVEQQEIR